MPMEQPKTIRMRSESKRKAFTVQSSQDDDSSSTLQAADPALLKNRHDITASSSPPPPPPPSSSSPPEVSDQKSDQHSTSSLKHIGKLSPWTTLDNHKGMNSRLPQSPSQLKSNRLRKSHGGERLRKAERRSSIGDSMLKYLPEEEKISTGREKDENKINQIKMKDPPLSSSSPPSSRPLTTLEPTEQEILLKNDESILLGPNTTNIVQKEQNTGTSLMITRKAPIKRMSSSDRHKKRLRNVRDRLDIKSSNLVYNPRRKVTPEEKAASEDRRKSIRERLSGLSDIIEKAKKGGRSDKKNIRRGRKQDILATEKGVSKLAELKKKQSSDRQDETTSSHQDDIMNPLHSSPAKKQTNNENPFTETSSPKITNIDQSIEDDTFSQKSRFQQMQKVKNDLFCLIEEWNGADGNSNSNSNSSTSKINFNNKRQTLMEQWALINKDLDCMVEHIRLCQDEDVKIRWDLIEIMVFPDVDEVGGDDDDVDFNNSSEFEIPHDAKDTHSRNISISSTSRVESMGFGDGDNDGDGESKTWDDNLSDFDNYGYGDDWAGGSEEESLTLLEEYQEVILDLYEMIEPTLIDLSPSESQIRKQCLVQLLQATSEEEAHLTSLSLDDVAETVYHVESCQRTNAPVRWDMIKDIVFPLGIDFSTYTTTATANDDTPSFENQGIE